MTEAHGTTDQRLDPELKAKWLAELRGGRYPQGRNYLLDNEGNYCCMGVLACVAGYGPEEIQCMEGLDEIKCDLLGVWDRSESSMTFSPIVPKSHTTLQRKLAGMNDSGKSFAEIADWIEVNL